MWRKAPAAFPPYIRLTDKHRRYAEEIGANHYLGKPCREETLLGLIRGYVGEIATA
jgi:chemosensory pili system protein ChpA (sensor histidine kinase/response regulator)